PAAALLPAPKETRLLIELRLRSVVPGLLLLLRRLGLRLRLYLRGRLPMLILLAPIALATAPCAPILLLGLFSGGAVVAVRAIFDVTARQDLAHRFGGRAVLLVLVVSAL